jgi:hypothetical protein
MNVPGSLCLVQMRCNSQLRSLQLIQFVFQLSGSFGRVKAPVPEVHSSWAAGVARLVFDL